MVIGETTRRPPRHGQLEPHDLARWLHDDLRAPGLGQGLHEEQPPAADRLGVRPVRLAGSPAGSSSRTATAGRLPAARRTCDLDGHRLRAGVDDGVGHELRHQQRGQLGRLLTAAGLPQGVDHDPRWPADGVGLRGKRRHRSHPPIPRLDRRCAAEPGTPTPEAGQSVTFRAGPAPWSKVAVVPVSVEHPAQRGRGTPRSVTRPASPRAPASRTSSPSAVGVDEGELAAVERRRGAPSWARTSGHESAASTGSAQRSRSPPERDLDGHRRDGASARRRWRSLVPDEPGRPLLDACPLPTTRTADSAPDGCARQDRRASALPEPHLVHPVVRALVQDEVGPARGSGRMFSARFRPLICSQTCVATPLGLGVRRARRSGGRTTTRR